MDQQQILNALATAFKTVSTPSAYHPTGPGGLFAQPGLDRAVFTAMQLPVQGLIAQLPVMETRYANPNYALFTGQTANSGDDPTGPCDDPKTVGTRKICTTMLPLGKQRLQTQSIDITEVGLYTNRGEFDDLQIFGGLDPTSGVAPGLPIGPMQTAITRDATAKLYALAVGWTYEFSRELYTGDPSNNDGDREYFYGLDTLVNTGYRDVFTGVACPRADSYVVDMDNLVVNSNGTTYVKRVSNMYRYLQDTARKAGLPNTSWRFVMHPNLFYELSEVWPCAYHTTGCEGIATTTNDTTQFIDARDNTQARDEMRGDMIAMTGQFLMIDGQRVPVILDDTVTEEASAGVFSSPIYLLPFTTLGRMPVLYMEYFSFAGQPIDTAEMFSPGGSYQVVDGGRFLLHKKPPLNNCLQITAQARTRLVLRTPHLAGRLDNVAYTTVSGGHFPDWEPGDTYYTDGGKLLTTPQSYYSPTS
jgi:hypothetical protein